ncbi:50S ribosomal protein L16 [Candidatus Peregrinibacteria bacterium CG08_land_8_20_14_0_20_41_10]|nr:MAG: 50S ribosomal protein L16 [Candidatus Peregrinibacteria bacterium CG1_02_41_10]PIS32267.1 MAG: 50S ribosomal protein L16 [Candidatus Peregrinibacteria bacterium CG08_land_8_20_14_0_20_41_10]
MLFPKKTKYRKTHRGRLKGVSQRGSRVSFGEFGLKATERGHLTARQIEAGRRVVARKIKRKGKVWVMVFPDKPVTCKPAEVKLGGGKGNVDHYEVNILPGRVIFEMAGVEEDLAREALRLAAAKIPMKTKFVIAY